MTSIQCFGKILPRVLLLGCMAVSLGTGSLPAIAGETPATPAAQESSGGEKLTLPAWSSLKQQAERFYAMPPGAQRVAGCEAFLREHPEYPNPEPLYRIIVEDSLQSGSYDPKHVAEIVEKLAEPEILDLSHGRSGLLLVERYYLKYDLPLEGAQRILSRSRQALEKSRAESALEMDPEIREFLWLDSVEFELLLDEGRVLLAGGDAAAALRKLQEAEEHQKRTGGFVELRPMGGKETTYLPSVNPIMNAWNLAMAQALARLGNAKGAAEHLSWVRGSLGIYGYLDSEVEKLRSKLKMTDTAALMLRSDPTPAAGFSLPDLEGRQVDLSAYKGKVVLLYVWATG
jgi:hypothetical protein